MNYTTQAQEVLKLAAESAELMQASLYRHGAFADRAQQDLFRCGRPGAGYEWSQRGRHAEDHE